MPYQAYGYELNKLMDKYGVQSPVAPRQQEGQSPDAYQAILNQYQGSVASTPEYNIPEGSPTYRQLLQNTLYGDPKKYYETRGITDPFEMYKKADVFGWTPQQWDNSMGKPAGTAQEWIDANNPTSSRVPYTYPYATGHEQGVNSPPGISTPATTQTPQVPQVTPPTTGQPTTPAPAPSPAESVLNQEPWMPTEDSGWQAPAGYNAQDSSTWSPAERSYADDYNYDFRTGDLRDLSSLQSYMTQAKGTVGNEFGTDNRVIDSGEADNIFHAAAALNVSPSQIASMLGMEGVDEDAVINRLKTSYPTEALNYLKQYGHGYAEGGMVTGYAEGGDVDPLDAILQRYLNREEPNTSATMDTIRQNAAARKAAIEQMNVPQVGPSDSEKWLKLAAAFANPGQTGNFMEGAGQAAGVLAEHAGAKREFDAAESQRRNQIALQALGIDQDVAESELHLGLEDRNRQDNQLSDMMRHYEGVAERNARAAEGEADRALQREIRPVGDLSLREQAQVRVLTTQYEGYLKAAQTAQENGEPEVAAQYAEQAARVEEALGALLSGDERPSAGPAVGSVVDGFEFMGGNPNDEAAWRPAGSAPAPMEPTANAPAPAAPETVAPLSALEGFNLEAPPVETPIQRGLGAIREGITDRLEASHNERQARLAAPAVEMIRGIIASRDIFKLEQMSDQQIQAALQSGMLEPDEIQIVTEFLSR